MTQILSVASECAPLVKTGGLADVVGALPAAMADQGIVMRTLLPGYPAVMEAISGGDVVFAEDDLFGGPARVLAAGAHGLDLYVVDAPHLYDRPGSIYLNAAGRDWSDNPERFAALSWVAARLADGAASDGWRPDLLHCHDWQAGLAPLYLRTFGLSTPSVMTIHNIAFHGLTGADRLAALRLPDWAFSPEGLEFYGQISALKAGLVYASQLTTVSPTYAQELMTPQFGMALDGVIRARASDLTGILNGIDMDAWDPSSDPEITAYKTPKGKSANKTALQNAFGLPQADGPLAVVISRLTEQKGLDLLAEALPGFLARGGQLALLGSGEAALEEVYVRAAEQYENVGVRIGYDEALSHRMMAGGDIIIVPSRFEPCGLTQLYGLRYGTIPVVARTGGLADTVVDANTMALRAGVATGVQFAPVTALALSDALSRICDLYADGAIWNKMRRNAMAQQVGWQASAQEYGALYRSLESTE